MEDLKFLIWDKTREKWWKPAACGYTADAQAAGQFTLKEAAEIVDEAHLGLHIVTELLLPITPNTRKSLKI